MCNVLKILIKLSIHLVIFFLYLESQIESFCIIYVHMQFQIFFICLPHPLHKIIITFSNFYCSFSSFPSLPSALHLFHLFPPFFLIFLFSSAFSNSSSFPPPLPPPLPFLSQFTIRAKHFTCRSQPLSHGNRFTPPPKKDIHSSDFLDDPSLFFFNRPLAPPHRPPFPLTHRLRIFPLTGWLSTYFPISLSPLDYLWLKEDIRGESESKKREEREMHAPFLPSFFLSQYLCLSWELVRGWEDGGKKRERERKERSEWRKGEARSQSLAYKEETTSFPHKRETRMAVKNLSVRVCVGCLLVSLSLTKFS